MNGLTKEGKGVYQLLLPLGVLEGNEGPRTEDLRRLGGLKVEEEGMVQVGKDAVEEKGSRDSKILGGGWM